MTKRTRKQEQSDSLTDKEAHDNARQRRHDKFTRTRIENLVTKNSNTTPITKEHRSPSRSPDHRECIRSIVKASQQQKSADRHASIERDPQPNSPAKSGDPEKEATIKRKLADLQRQLVAVQNAVPTDPRPQPRNDVPADRRLQPRNAVPADPRRQPSVPLKPARQHVQTSPSSSQTNSRGGKGEHDRNNSLGRQPERGPASSSKQERRDRYLVKDLQQSHLPPENRHNNPSGYGYSPSRRKEVGGS